jgi:hypothetical protein
MADHLEASRNDLEQLGDIFADAPQHAAAIVTVR